MNSIQEYLLSCNDTVGIKKDPAGIRDELYIYKSNADGSHSAYKVAMSPTSKDLILYVGPNAPRNVDFSSARPQTMSSYIKSMTADIAPDGKSIQLTLGYAIGSKTYTGKQTIAFRNTISSFSIT